MSSGNSTVNAVLFVATGGMWGGIGDFKGLNLQLLDMLTPAMPDGPRLNDLSVQASTYGMAIPIAYGPQNRIAGNVIWSTGLLETAKEAEGGGKGGGDAPMQYSYRTSVAVAVAGREVSRLGRVWANKKLIYDPSATDAFDESPSKSLYDEIFAAAGKGATFADIRAYPGSDIQMPDPTMESYLGVGNVPAYRGIAYVVIKDLQLADFGNALPQLEFEIIADESISVGGIIRDIGERAGVPIIATFADEPVLGYAVGKGMDCVKALAPLQTAYDLAIVEQGGQMRVENRAYTIHATIPNDALAAKPAKSSGANESYQFGRASLTSLPREVMVSYPDPAFDYQVSSQIARRSERDSQNKESVEVAVVMTADKARRLAGKILWQRWAESRTVEIDVGAAWSRLQVGKIVAVEIAGGLVPFRVAKIARGNNGVWKVEGSYEDSLAYLDDTPGGVVTATTQPVRVTGTTELMLLNTPLLREIDDGNGFHWGATTTDTLWRGASIQRSVDGGISYTEMSPTSVRALVADAAVPLPAGTTAVWDLASSVTVTLRGIGELSSADEEQVLAGANVAWLGRADGSVGEVIQWRDATMIAPGVYTLTNLLRGRLGTEFAVGTHIADEVFVRLDLSLGLSDFGASDWDKVRKFKPVSRLQTLADTVAQDFTNNGERRMCKSPVHIAGVRTSGDLAITWVRRTRIPFTGLEAVAPLGEASEAYEIDIMSGATVVRTITATTESATYTAAQQTTDFGAPQSSVTMNVYQLSETRGRGHAGAAIV